MENNQIDEGRRGLEGLIFGEPGPELTWKQKLGAALGAVAATATTMGGAYAGHVAANAIRDTANHPELLKQLKTDSGKPRTDKWGKPITPMSGTYSVAEPAGAVLGLATGLGGLAGVAELSHRIGERRRRKSSPSQPLKEHYKQILSEALFVQ